MLNKNAEISSPLDEKDKNKQIEPYLNWLSYAEKKRGIQIKPDGSKYKLSSLKVKPLD